MQYENPVRTLNTQRLHKYTLKACVIKSQYVKNALPSMYSVCVCVCVKCTRASDKNLRNKSSTDWTFFVFRYHDFPCICFSVFSSFSEISCPILTYTRRYKQNLFNHTLSKNLTFLFPCLHKLVSYVKVKSNLTCALFADTNVSAREKTMVLLVVHAH